MKYTLYMIKFPNNKNYIGQTTDLKRRLRQYKHECKHPKRPVSFAINKYGLDNISFVILFDNIETKEEINILEKQYIIKYNTQLVNNYGYNITDGGDGSVGYKPTTETLKKLSISHIGKKWTSNQHTIMSSLPPPMLGKNHTQETKNKISASLSGRKIPSNIISKFSGENHGKAKLTKQEVLEIRNLYTTGKYSQSQLGKIYNISKSTVAKILNKKIWKNI